MEDPKKSSAAMSESMDVDVRFRLTSNEKSRLAEAAAAAGMSLSAYIRTSLLEGHERPVSVPKRGQTKVHHVYLTDDDWAGLRHNAINSGLTASAFIRERCVGRDPKFNGNVPTACIPSPEDMNAVWALLWELKRQGNNWNQIAHRLNFSNDVDGDAALLCDEMRQLARRSVKLINKIDDLFAASVRRDSCD